MTTADDLRVTRENLTCACLGDAALVRAFEQHMISLIKSEVGPEMQGIAELGKLFAETMREMRAAAMGESPNDKEFRWYASSSIRQQTRAFGDS